MAVDYVALVKAIRQDHVRKEDKNGAYCVVDDRWEWPCDAASMIEAYDAATQLAANSVNANKQLTEDIQVAIGREEMARKLLIGLVENMDPDSASSQYLAAQSFLEGK